MKRDTEKMYAAMKPWKLFFIVALPGMVSMFAMSIYSIIEGIFIGQKLGEGAFAAVNIAMPLVMINFSLADLIGVGASVPISIALGKKDHKTANNVFSCSVIMIFISSVLMGIIMFLAAEPLYRFFGKCFSLFRENGFFCLWRRRDQLEQSLLLHISDGRTDCLFADTRYLYNLAQRAVISQKTDCVKNKLCAVRKSEFECGFVISRFDLTLQMIAAFHIL